MCLQVTMLFIHILAYNRFLQVTSPQIGTIVQFRYLQVTSLHICTIAFSMCLQVITCYLHHTLAQVLVGQTTIYLYGCLLVTIPVTKVYYRFFAGRTALYLCDYRQYMFLYVSETIIGAFRSHCYLSVMKSILGVCMSHNHKSVPQFIIGACRSHHCSSAQQPAIYAYPCILKRYTLTFLTIFIQHKFYIVQSSCYEHINVFINFFYIHETVFQYKGWFIQLISPSIFIRNSSSFSPPYRTTLSLVEIQELSRYS